MKPVKGGSALDKRNFNLNKKKAKELVDYASKLSLYGKITEQHAKDINEILNDMFTQQRTELLEEILNLECLKEWEVGEKGGNRDEVGIANFVIKQIKEEIKKL